MSANCPPYYIVRRIISGDDDDNDDDIGEWHCMKYSICSALQS